MTEPDALDRRLRDLLAVEPPPGLEARIVQRMDALRAVDLVQRRRIRRAALLRGGIGFAIVAFVNGLTPRVVLGPIGRWLDALERWTAGLRLPEQLVTVHGPAVLAAALLLAAMATSALVRSHPRTE